MNKLYKLGETSGRFQHIHKTHEFLIKNGLELCEKLIVFIGDPHLNRIPSNPFTWQERKYLIEQLFLDDVEKGRLIIYPLENVKGNISNWCSYMCKKSELICGIKPNLIIEGVDKRDIPFFKEDDMNNISELVVSENILMDNNFINIRGTKVREYLLNNDFDNWSKCVNSKLYSEYDRLRNIIKECN